MCEFIEDWGDFYVSFDDWFECVGCGVRKIWEIIGIYC